ncbi:aminoglycoside phosphotransferase [Actinoplanes sp. TRM 88003]|uniref:Aminoglycoside phosphotransferase n=1 Tax=Paractinoplanes aksuensis TaxID=2939490 RepID=A0ABT1DNL7_9ACTN|nr:aminoglycoside phosphotransferase [Actinoplanes aksuensis]MCO8272437.1 aminoglycoside phosphotransferase [Actinoplanes aksuensis]
MRAFLTVDDVTGLVAEQLGRGRRVTHLERLTGGTKKGVYRIRLDDDSSVVLYVWAAAEDYWPPSVTVPDDPFTDASGAHLFLTNQALLAGAGVRVPEVLFADGDRVLVEDVGSETLEARMEYDRAPLRELGRTLRRMHTTLGPEWGRPASLNPQARTPEEVVLDRALAHLRAVVGQDERMAAAGPRIEDHLRGLRGRVEARREYVLVHGELGPDHVFMSAAGEPVMIDIEGVTYFDVEWEHAFLQLRFQEAYAELGPVDLDPARLELYRVAQVIALIEGPLRIAGTDFPNRQWMLDLAEWNIQKALALGE